MSRTNDQPPVGERRWLSVAELARELGMSQMTLYRVIAAGQFPAVRIGRRLVVPARVLEDMAAAALATGMAVTALGGPTVSEVAGPTFRHAGRL